MKRGKLIVFEGTDGSGKSTQVKLLFNYLKRKGISSKIISFPRYDKFYGNLAGRVLKGEFGGNSLSPYLTALPFATDRLMAKKKINRWLDGGQIVLVDRYVGSSLAHQGAKLRGEKQKELVEWVLRMEYKINQLPREDIVIFLDLPVNLTQNLLKIRNLKKDIAEKDVEYQKQSIKLYHDLIDKFKHWQTVKGVDEKGKLLSKDEMHQRILRILKQGKIIGS